MARKRAKKRAGSDGSTPAKSQAPAATKHSDATLPKKPLRRWQVILALLLLPLLLLLGAFAIDRASHQGQILRGVKVGELSLAGLDLAGAEKRLEEWQASLAKTPVPVQVRAQTFDLAPSAIGFSVDRGRMAREALEAGRSAGALSQLRWWLARWIGPHQLEPRPLIDKARLLAEIARWQKSAIDNPAFEGAVRGEAGRGLVVELPRPGQAIDRPHATEALLRGLVMMPRKRLTLEIVEQQPQRAAKEVRAAAKKAKKLLSATVSLVAELPPPTPIIPGPGERKKARRKARAKRAAARARAKGKKEEPPTERFDFAPDLLTRALRSQPNDDGSLTLELDSEIIDDALAGARKVLERPPVDARFEVDEKERVSIVAGRAARVLDPARVAKAILEASLLPERQGVLPVQEGETPKFTTRDAKALGIAGMVSKFTTRHPCCRPRVKNIHRMADMIDGYIVKPGEIFSINQHVGERRASKGFLPAPTIVHGKMKDTVGGGVSQFATTFFNAAFYGGYDIVERQPHSYYFRRYPMGHEATLSFPKPDVIIRNDTGAGLLIRVEYGPNSLTVKFYGDNEGRKVERKVSPIQDLVDPPIEYEPDESLDPEDEKVEEKGKKGWTVQVSRTIIYADGRREKQGRKVIYKPRVRKLRVHPCKIPEGEEGHTGKDCPEEEEPVDLEGGGVVEGGGAVEGGGVVEGGGGAVPGGEP